MTRSMVMLAHEQRVTLANGIICFSFGSNANNKLGLNNRQGFLVQMKNLLNKVLLCSSLLRDFTACSSATKHIKFVSMTCTVQVKLLDNDFSERTVITFKVQVDGKNVPTAVKVLSKHRVLDVSLGANHSAALVEPGLVYTFGDNQMGQLACGNCKPRDVPAIVKALEDKTTAVRTGFYSSVW